MTSKAKLFGSVLLAMLAMGTAAATAEAANDFFRSEEEKTLIKAETEVQHTLIVGTSSLSCNIVERETTMANSIVESLSFTPVYKECKFAGKTATIRMNACAYVYTGQTELTEDALVYVECPGESVIEIEVDNFFGPFSCTITFFPQPVEGGAVYTNLGEENTRTITVEATLEKIGIATDGPGPACAELSKNPAKTTATFILKGREDQGANQQVGIWVQ
jgi:hypothetical protein